MEEKTLQVIAQLLKQYRAKDNEISNFIEDLKQELDKADGVDDGKLGEEDLDDEEEYNAQANVESILGKDFDLEKDKELKDLIAKKYAR